MYQLYTIDNQFIEETNSIPKNFSGILVLPSGTKYWYKNDQLHRENGPAIENKDGSWYWFKNGKRHRSNGPAALNSNGSKEYWDNGKAHRIGGPALEHINGHSIDLYFISNKVVTKQEHDLLVDILKLKILVS